MVRKKQKYLNLYKHTPGSQLSTYDGIHAYPLKKNIHSIILLLLRSATSTLLILSIYTYFPNRKVFTSMSISPDFQIIQAYLMKNALFLFISCVQIYNNKHKYEMVLIFLKHLRFFILMLFLLFWVLVSKFRRSTLTWTLYIYTDTYIIKIHMPLSQYL